MTAPSPTIQPWLAAPDERVEMGYTTGLLWLLSAAVVLLAGLLPGAAPASHGAMVAVGAYALLFGVASVSGRLPWARMPMWQHIARFVLTVPMLAVAQWGTGGADSFALPLIALPLFFAAYFYPPRVAWPLVGLLVCAMAAPFAYEPTAVADGFAAIYATFTVAALTLTGVVLHLKGRLLDAERTQREMAFRDPLTALSNRRAFDAALTAAVSAAADADRPTAVLFLDLDRFKRINDEYGHEAGDRALCAVADRCRSAVRPTDTLARIGGDEFAVVAPDAGSEGADRLAAVLADAVCQIAPAEGAEPLRATVSWALLGRDGSDGAELMRTADRRLYAAKRQRVPAPV
ncbi:MAG: GGDEF domain-containing protein [Thermoleophilaceae bacterium]